MTPDRYHRTPHDHLIDEILDGQADHDRSQDLLRAIRHDARACEALARTRIGIERLREPVDAPDLSGQILSRVHARRRFLPGRARRLVTAGRVAVAAGIVGAVALGSFVQRHAPQVRLADSADAAPVSRIVEAAVAVPFSRVDDGADATPATHVVVATEQTAPPQAGLDHAVATIEASLSAPVRPLALSPRYRPNAELHFDLSLERTTYPGATGYAYAVNTRPIVVGAPLVLDDPAPAADSAFISRFGSLLVILREPSPALDDLKADD